MRAAMPATSEVGVSGDKGTWERGRWGRGGERETNTSEQGGGASDRNRAFTEISVSGEVGAGLTNSVNFTEIRRIRSPPNFKIGDFTVHRFKIFEKIKNM
jgi:hypothetical protein